MRFHEIAVLLEDQSQVRFIVASPRFFQEYPKFVQKYTNFRANLREFLLFRQTAPVNQPFNGKDGALAGSTLGPLNLRRVHLIHGKALVIYQLPKDEIRLVTVDEHTGVEGKRVGVLAQYVASLTPEDYEKFDIPELDVPKKKAAPEPEPLTDQESKNVKSLFLQLVTHPQDRPVIVAAAKDDIAGFMQWARMALDLDINDTSRDKAILLSLGGRNILVQRAKLWLEKTASMVQEPPAPEALPPAPPPVSQPVQKASRPRKTAAAGSTVTPAKSRQETGRR